MDKRLKGLNSGLFKYFCQVTLAAVATGFFQYWAWTTFTFHNEILKLIVMGIAGLIFYEMVCLALKIKQAQKIAQWVRGEYKRQD